MTQQVIDIGAAPDDDTGDPLRTSFDKTNDNFTELYAKGATEGLWNYNKTSTDTTTAPVSGRFKTNSGNYRDATQIAINAITIQGIDRSNTLRTLLVGDLVQCQDSTNSAAWCRFGLQSLPVDHGTWFQLNVTFQADGGVASGDNQEIVFVFTASSGSAAVGAPVGAEYITSTSDATLTAERVLTDTASVIWDRTTPGQIKANAAAAVPVPQRTVFTFGSGTYPTPAGATWLEVELVGGGGGGAGGAGTGATNGGNGISSTFSGLSALGGIGGTTGPSPGAGGGTSGTSISDATSTGGDGGNANDRGQGGVGGSSAFGGQSYATGSGARGAGGAGGGNSPGAYGGGGGGAGGYIQSIITSPAVSYSYTIGPGGSAGNAGSPSGGVGSAGNTGIIVVTAHF